MFVYNIIMTFFNLLDDLIELSGLRNKKYTNNKL
jgi:hypothetical protein